VAHGRSGIVARSVISVPLPKDWLRGNGRFVAELGNLALQGHKPLVGAAPSHARRLKCWPVLP
jgi:hypothetical protein